MNDSRITRASLLIRLEDGQDGAAWAEFVEIYTPAVYGFLQRRGLQDADVADVTQDVFRTVARTVGRFDCKRRKGSFRGWLFAVVRSRLADFLAAKQRQQSGSGDTRMLAYLEQQPCQDDAEHLWEQEYRRGIFDWATRQIRSDFTESSWQAFWRTSVEDESARQVAASLGISEGAVYIAKCRVLARIKETIDTLENEA